MFNIYSRLTLDLSNFTASIANGARRVDQFARGMEKTFAGFSRKFGKLSGDLAMLAGPGLAALWIGFRKVIDEGGNIADLSKQLNISASALSELGYAASLSGIKLEEVAAGIGKMQKTLGSGKENSVLRRMGLNPEELRKAAPEVAFEKVLDAIGKLGDQAKRTEVVTSIFDKSGGVFLRMAKDGATGIEALRAEARALGISIDDNMASKLDDLGDNLDRTKARIEGLGRAIKIQLAPTIEELVRKFADALKGITEFSKAHPKLTSAFINISVGAIVLNGVLAVTFGLLANITKVFSMLIGGARGLFGFLATAGTKILAGIAATLRFILGIVPKVLSGIIQVADAFSIGGLSGVGSLAVGGGTAGLALAAGGLGGGYAGYKAFTSGLSGENSMLGWLLGAPGRFFGERYGSQRTALNTARSGILGPGVKGADALDKNSGVRAEAQMEAMLRKLQDETNRRIKEQTDLLKQIAANTAPIPGTISGTVKLAAGFLP